MKINWKLRLMNKTTLSAIIVTIIAFVYQILGMLGIVPAISESEVVEIVGVLINLLVLVGVITDPTTAGVLDSEQAMNYSEPRKS